jgi:hypothetical protein
LIGAGVSEADFRFASRAFDHTHAQKCFDLSATLAVEPGRFPQLPSNYDRLNLVGLPPRGLVTMTVEGAMVTSAQRDCVFVANPPAKSARLRKSQMMSVRRPSAAYEARVRRYEPKVRTVAVAARFAKRERAFVDVPGDRIVDWRWRFKLTGQIF